MIDGNTTANDDDNKDDYSIFDNPRVVKMTPAGNDSDSPVPQCDRAFKGGAFCEPSSVPSVPKEEEDERSGPLWRVLILVALVLCWEVSKMPYDSRNEGRVAKKQLRKMRQKSLPSGPPSVELQAPIPGVLS
jgi:hypothetical protein